MSDIPGHVLILAGRERGEDLWVIQCAHSPRDPKWAATGPTGDSDDCALQQWLSDVGEARSEDRDAPYIGMPVTAALDGDDWTLTIRDGEGDYPRDMPPHMTPVGSPCCHAPFIFQTYEGRIICTGCSNSWSNRTGEPHANNKPRSDYA